MKNNLYKLNIAGIIILLLLFLVSCEDVVDVELNEEDIDLVAVEAYINTKATDNIYVRIEKSLAVNVSETNPAVSNATVEISDNADVPNTVILEEQGNTGVYKLPAGTEYEAIPGRTYQLTITTPDGTVISGEEYLQEVEQLDTVKINLSERVNYEYLGIYINSQETPGEGHYYKWDIYINGELLYESENLSFASDELVDGNYIYDLLIAVDWADDDEDKFMKLGDTVVVEQLSISKDAYKFYWSMTDQAFSGSPFSVPPANLPSNLSSSDGKKVLGLFSARDISVGNEVVIDESNYTPHISSLLVD